MSQSPDNLENASADRKRIWPILLAFAWVASGVLLLVLDYSGFTWAKTVLAVIVIVPLAAFFVAGFLRGNW